MCNVDLKKKAHPDVMASEWTKDEEYQIDTHSNKKYIIISKAPMSTLFEEEDEDSESSEGYPVRDILLAGKENAVSPDEVCRRLDIRDKRTLRAELNRERCAGAVILTNSSRGGYYLPGCRDEVEEYVNIMVARIKTSYASLKAALKLLEEGAEG